MKPSLAFTRPVWLGSFLGLLFCLTFAGCGHHASRPASSLSGQDRSTLSAYEDIRAALVIDDLRTAKHVALNLDKTLKPTPETPSTPLEATVQELSVAPNLDKARTAFKNLSADVIPLIDGVQGFYVMESPVPAGAEWVQTTPEIDNPYVGKPMRTTGSLRR